MHLITSLITKVVAPGSNSINHRLALAPTLSKLWQSKLWQAEGKNLGPGPLNNTIKVVIIMYLCFFN